MSSIFSGVEATMEDKKILYPGDISRETGLSLNLIYRLLRSGQIKSTKAGDRYLISRENYNYWVSGHGPAQEVDAAKNT
jgi:excisionase family DNA binding protein